MCILDDDDAYDHDNDDDDDHNWMKWRSRSPGGSGRVWSMAAWLTNGWLARQKLSLPRISYSDQLELILYSPNKISYSDTVFSIFIE